MDQFKTFNAFSNDSNKVSSESAIAKENQNISIDDSKALAIAGDLPKTSKKTNNSTTKCDDAKIELESDQRNEKIVPKKVKQTAVKKPKRKKGLLAGKYSHPLSIYALLQRTAKVRKRQVQKGRFTIYSFDESERSTNVGSPPVIPAFVDLVSEDEFVDMPISINRNLANEPTTLQTSENDEMRVVVKFAQKMDHYMLRPFQKISELIEKVASRHKVNAETIFLVLDGKIVPASNSLRDIDYIPGLTICAYVAENNFATSHNDGNTKRSNQIELKIQTENLGRKLPFVVHIGKSDQISSLFFQCAEEFKCNPNKIRLEFDGELLDSNKTAAENELEGGEVIDMFISNK